MAEFCEVIFKYKEMCKGADCDKCPLSQTRNGYGLKCDELLTDIPVAFERIVMTQPMDGREVGKTCPRCGSRMAMIIDKLGNPKGLPVVYCWCCGQAIRWAKEEA